MSRFEQLRAELENIKRDAAQREAAQRAVRLEEERETAEEQRELLERQKRIEDNRPAFKQIVSKTLININRQVLDSSGKVTGWKKKQVEEEFSYDTGPPEHVFTYHHLLHHIEICELRIPKVGKIFSLRDENVSEFLKFGSSIDFNFVPYDGNESVSIINTPTNLDRGKIEDILTAKLSDLFRNRINFAKYAEKKSQAVSEDFWDHLGTTCGRLFRDIRDSLQ